MINIKGMVLWSFVVLAFMTCSSTTEEKSSTSEDQQKDIEAKSQGWFVTIKGRVETTPQGSHIYVSELNNPSGGERMDTIIIKSDNTFEKKINLTEPGYYKLNFFNTQVANVILYKSDLDILVQGQPNGEVEIKGSPEIDFIGQATDILQGVQASPEAIKLNEDFNKAKQVNDQTRMVQIQEAYMDLMMAKQQEVADLIKKQPASLGVINLLQNNVLDKDQFFDVYASVAKTLKAEWPNYGHAQQFIQMVDQMQATSIGQEAPEIALPDPDGKIIKLSSLRGKYVLVDFWAKWCGPCRAENPNVVRVYNKYKDKGFTVFGVSLDRKKEDWVQAIQADGLTWTHVSDLKFWQSEAAKTYNITAIPFSLLLDPNGVIIAKNLRGSALEAKLKEVIK